MKNTSIPKIFGIGQPGVFTGGAGIPNYYTASVTGYNAYGQLGDNTTITRSSPVQLPGSWKAVGGGDTHTLAIKSDGTLWAWGNNLYGQCAQNNILASWISVAAGTSNGYAVRSDGAVFGWGYGGAGGLGAARPASVPTMVSVTAGVKSITAGTGCTFAISTLGQLWAWGYNGFTYNLGTNETILYRSYPIQIATGTSFSMVSGSAGGIALSTGGTAYTWGQNTAGQCGINTTTNRPTPTGVNPTGVVSKVSAGGGTNYLITTSGTIYASGANGSGQIGDGTTIGRSVFTQLTTTTSSFTAISGGNSRVLAIDVNGKLWAWGAGANGQLGDNTTISKSVPTLIDSNSWYTVSCNSGASYALRDDRTLWVWGDNSKGQLGLGDFINRSSPTQIPSYSWSLISSGGTDIFFGITTNSVLQGAGFDSTPGLMGMGTTGKTYNRIVQMIPYASTVSISRSSPTQIGTESDWIAVSTGNGKTSYGIRQGTYGGSGILYAWGGNDNGQIGDGTIISKSSPVQVLSNDEFKNVIGAGFGYDTVFAAGLTRNNQLYTWGDGSKGQLGNGSTISRSSPTQVSIGGNWKTFALDRGSLFAITTAGALYSTGLSDNGQLGLGSTVSRSTLFQIGTSAWNAVATNFVGTVAGIKSDGVLQTWGWAASGITLGDGSTVNRSVPVSIGGTFTDWNSIQGGDYYFIAGRAGDPNSVYGWGSGSTGKFGNNSTANRNQLQITYTAPNNTNFIPSGGSNSTLFQENIPRTLVAYAWGQGDGGEIGDGTTINRSFPTQIPTYSWTTVSSHRNFSVGITYDGKIYTWGGNNAGQLGNGSTINRSLPTQIGTSFGWGSLPVGWNADMSGSIKTNGSLFLWGYNSSGQLGINTTAARSNPVQIAGSWKTISVSSYTLAIKNDSTLWAWGYNLYGSLGTSSTIYRSSPVQIGTSSWSYVYAGFLTSAGIKIDGTLWTWGDNSYGTLGINSAGRRSSPVQVGSNNDWTYVTGGNGYMIALRANGSLWSWGLNDAGYLGDGTTITKSSPIQIGTNTNWQLIAAGSAHVAAVDNVGRIYTWGTNQYGQLGLGDTIRRSSPVQISSVNRVTYVSAGIYNTFVLYEK